MSRDRDAILKAILDSPGDDLPRLAFADWCEENGDPDRGEFIRVQLELARWTDDDGWMPMGLNRESLRAREKQLFRESGPKWWDDLPGRYRSTEDHARIVAMGGLAYKVRRGFVDSVECPMASWLLDGVAIATRHPVRSVSIKDKRPTGLGFSWWRGPKVADDHCELLRPWDIPAEIYDLLDHTMTDSYTMHPSDEHAMLALGEACILWARSQ